MIVDYISKLINRYRIEKTQAVIVQYAYLTCNSMSPQHTSQSTYNHFWSLGLSHHLDSLESWGLEMIHLTQNVYDALDIFWDVRYVDIAGFFIDT